LPLGSHGKEGVDGSSPSEGSAKAAQLRLFRSSELVRVPVCGGMEPLMELSDPEGGS
jgi:hypothetical protein